ncbi:MAG TPA: SIS domain-containing protein [Parafilimonas sp.]|nr:SIS domain-containing protein [Parafilimonas sp.]
MHLLTLNENYLTKKGALHTAKEISGQPELWNNTAALFYSATDAIEKFLNSAYAEANNIILTGAGTSAFVGLSLHGAFFRNTKIITRPIATTDIVSHPQDYFNDNQTSLVISFARSGNSPESCAVLELADKFSKKCFHFIITCDKDGALAQYQSNNPSYIFVLPDAANDKSLAMTGSYSSMLLTGLLIAYLNDKEKCKQQVDFISKAAQKIFDCYLPLLQQVAEKDFKRAMFLGSGALYGTATEAALKLQELTDGKVICKTDSYLGLRHGPKAVIDEDTLVIYFFSNDEYANRYEQDLVNAMKDGNDAMFCLGISESAASIANTDAQISFGVDAQKIMEDFLPVCSVLVGQLLGFYKSLQLGLMPDAPSVNGAISRVVQGVNIYPVEERKSMMNNLRN